MPKRTYSDAMVPARRGTKRRSTRYKTMLYRPAGFPGSYALASARGPRQEQKFVDVAAAAYNADTTGSVTLLNGVAQGDDFNNRIGRQATWKSVSIRGILYNVDQTTNNAACRLLVVWDNSPNSGSAPAITDFLVASTATTHNNLNNRHRFKTLIDEYHCLGTFSNVATQSYVAGPGVKEINRFLRLPDAVTVFSGTGATVGSIQSGAIWLVTIGDQGAGLGGQFSVTTRCRFTDA